MSRVILSIIVAVAALVGHPSPALAAETCQGRPATIVGAPDQEIEGTDGADVIVTNGAIAVEAGAGDDLVCTTGSFPHDPNRHTWDVYVDAGAGADVIDRSGDIDPATRGTVKLQGGGDTFLGADGEDRVYVDTPGQGSVRTGAGDDKVVVERAVHPRLEPDGGAGADELTVEAGADGSWELDLSTGTAPSAARTVTGSGFEWVSFDASDAPGASVRFTGSDADETLTLDASTGREGTLGAGDDRLRLVKVYRSQPDPRGIQALDGGAGTDTIDVTVFHTELRIDLAEDRLDYRLDNAGAPQSMIPGFEDVSAYAGPIRVLGDSGANVIEWNGCPGIVRGRGGDDVIDWKTSGAGNPCGKNGGTSAAWGNAGDDVLIGGNRQDDRLIGGSGTDSARGGGGRDLCRAETTTGCERS